MKKSNIFQQVVLQMSRTASVQKNVRPVPVPAQRAGLVVPCPAGIRSAEARPARIPAPPGRTGRAGRESLMRHARCLEGSPGLPGGKFRHSPEPPLHSRSLELFRAIPGPALSPVATRRGTRRPCRAAKTRFSANRGASRLKGVALQPGSVGRPEGRAPYLPSLSAMMVRTRPVSLGRSGLEI